MNGGVWGSGWGVGILNIGGTRCRVWGKQGDKAGAVALGSPDGLARRSVISTGSVWES